MAARAQTGRADLLMALSRVRDEPPQLVCLGWGDDDDWGYRRSDPAPPAEPQLLIDTSHVPAPSTSGGVQPTPYRLPLRMPPTWVMASTETLAAAEPTANDTLPPLAPSDAEGAAVQPGLAHDDLMPWPRLWPSLFKALSRPVPGRLAIDPVIASMARLTPLHRLPRLAVPRLSDRVIVALDFGRATTPYHDDFHSLCRRLQRGLARSHVELRVLSAGLRSPWRHWQAQLDAQLPRWHDWRDPAPGEVLLIVSDLGLNAGHRAAHIPWLKPITELAATQRPVVVLAPVERELLPTALCRAATVLPWMGATSPQAAAGSARTQAHPNARPDTADVPGSALRNQTQDLLALLALCLHAEPRLLRQLRKHLPGARHRAGLEGLVWSSPWFAADCVGHVGAVHRQRLLDRLQTDAALTATGAKALDQIAAAHRHLRAAQRHGEALRGHAHLSNEPSLSAQARQRAGWATTFIRQLTQNLDHPAAAPDAGGWLATGRALLAAADERTLTDHPQVWAALWGRVEAAHNTEADRGRQAAVVVDRRGLVLQFSPARRGQHLVALVRGANLWRVESTLGSHSRWASPQDWVFAREWWGSLVEELAVVTDQQRVVIRSVERPRGVEGWALDRTELVVALPPLAGRAAQSAGGAVPNAGGWLLELAARHASRTAPNGGVSVASAVTVPTDAFEWADPEQGIELDGGIDEWGGYADLSVRDPRGAAPRGAPSRRGVDRAATQRLRYIEPTTFRMGSPEGVGRSDEHPQHDVTLTQGFWLADTPCTQALWMAVMGGKNPSHFAEGEDAPERPVETVSWDDVQTFLKKLTARLPTGCYAVLPTEAQWEAACRAGTETAYHWGDQPDTARANMGGKIESTTPVKSFRPNPWGLHDMHGNVWEWCADGTRGYSGSPEVDPQGPLSAGASRAVRGGSWIFVPAGARSAFRFGGHPGSRNRSQGFRFALRSQSPVPGGPSTGQSPTGGRVGVLQSGRTESDPLSPAEPAALRKGTPRVQDAVAKPTKRPARKRAPKP